MTNSPSARCAVPIMHWAGRSRPLHIEWIESVDISGFGVPAPLLPMTLVCLYVWSLWIHHIGSAAAHWSGHVFSTKHAQYFRQNPVFTYTSTVHQPSIHMEEAWVGCQSVAACSHTPNVHPVMPLHMHNVTNMSCIQDSKPSSWTDCCEPLSHSATFNKITVIDCEVFQRSVLLTREREGLRFDSWTSLCILWLPGVYASQFVDAESCLWPGMWVRKMLCLSVLELWWLHESYPCPCVCWVKLCSM